MTGNYPNPVHAYRGAIKAHEARRFETSEQMRLQAAAVAKHEAEQAAREAYEQSLIVKESEPISQNPLVATSRFKPLPTKRASRVATARVNNKPLEGKQSE